MKNEDVGANVEGFLKFLKDASGELYAAKAEVDYCERKTQDILHELEIVDMTYHQRAHLSEELMNVRRQRREAKDMIELLTPVVEWAGNANLVIGKLQTCLGAIRKSEEKQKNRVYWKRADGQGEFIR